MRERGRERNARGSVYKKISSCWKTVMMFSVLTLSSRKRRYSLPNEPSGIDAISFSSSVARRILGLSLSITSRGKLILDQKKPREKSWEGAQLTYLRMVWPSGSFLILFLRFTNARCPVVSPSTATMSVLPRSQYNQDAPPDCSALLVFTKSAMFHTCVPDNQSFCDFQATLSISGMKSKVKIQRQTITLRVLRHCTLQEIVTLIKEPRH